MTSQGYNRVATEPSTTAPDINEDPLSAAFASDSNDSLSDWEDDRATPASLSARNSTSNIAYTSSNSTRASNSEHEPSSTWRGLLNIVSRPLSSTRAAASDGVFGNLIAKEESGSNEEHRELPIPDEDDDITPEDCPPTYDEASADATPSYWETTIMTYSYGDEIIVGQMPVGSLIIFAWNLLMSSAFSYVGFILTYLFHTTHSAKGGSLVGFGITLIQSSFDIKPIDTTPPGQAPPQLAPLDPNSFDSNAFDEEAKLLYPRPQIEAEPYPRHGNSLWLSNLVFGFGILMIIKGLWDYGMAMRMEAAILKRRREQEQQSEQAQATAADNQSPPPVEP